MINKPKLKKLFTKYTLIGIINTIVHWVCFFILIYQFNKTQLFANFFAFFIAVICSFVLNSLYTFNKQLKLSRFILYFFCMGAIALCTGLVADNININPWLTLCIFSMVSLFFGFLTSHFFVFYKND